MEVLFTFWMMGVVIYFILKFWERGVTISETKTRLTVAESQVNVSQTVLNNSYSENVNLKKTIEAPERDKQYWFNSYMTNAGTLDVIESYIYDNDLEETPSGSHILNIINGGDDEQL